MMSLHVHRCASCCLVCGVGHLQLSECMQQVFGVAAHVLTHSCCMGCKPAWRTPWRVCLQHAFFSLSCFLHHSGKKGMWTLTMQLGYTNTVMVFGYSYGHVPEHERYGSMHGFLPSSPLCFKGAPMTILGAPFAPLLLQCAAGFVCLQSFC